MKVQNPWIGRMRGSAGGMTGCKVYDKNVMRAKAFEVANPNTPAQQTQREFFAEINELTKSFSKELLQTLFPQKPKSMSRRNALTKQIAESYSIDGTEKDVDYSDITTLGNAPVMDFGTTTAVFSNGQIAVNLDQSVSSNVVLGEYYFFVALVNETKGAISITTENGQVSDGSILAAIPTGWETTDTIHAIPFITDSKSAITSFGSMSVNERPARPGRNPRQ